MIDYFITLNVKLLFVLAVFGFVMGQSRRIALNNFYRKSGGYFLMDFFNLIGTPVHETGHLIFGLLFGYHIDGICLYRRLKTAQKNGGTLGYVKMHHSSRTFWQKLQGNLGQFFVGIGPLLFGSLFIYGISFLLPDSVRTLPDSFGKGLSFFREALQQLKGSDIIFLFLFLYIIIGVSLNMELSKQDLKLASGGVFFLEVLFLMISALAVFFQWNLNGVIDYLFRWNLLISCTGIASCLTANLIALL